MYRKDVIDILAQFPDEAKILQAEGDVMQVYILNYILSCSIILLKICLMVL